MNDEKISVPTTQIVPKRQGLGSSRTLPSVPPLAANPIDEDLPPHLRAAQEDVASAVAAAGRRLGDHDEL